MMPGPPKKNPNAPLPLPRPRTDRLRGYGKGRRKEGWANGEEEEEEGPEAKWPRPSDARKWDIFGERRQRGEHFLTFGKKMAEKMQHCFGLQLQQSHADR